MLVLLLTFGVIGIAMAAMAIGVALSGRQLKGSCGGVGSDCECERAGIAPDKRTCAQKTHQA